MIELHATQFFLLLIIFAVGGFVAGNWFEAHFGESAKSLLQLRDQRDDAEQRFKVQRRTSLKLIEELLKHNTWWDIKHNILKDIYPE